MSTVALVDYGMGNRRSRREGARARRRRRPRVTADHEAIRAADAVVVPGVGAFPEAMRRLRAAGLDERDPRARRAAARPVLGICLGMQLLFERSDEHEGAAGLGLLPGEVTRARGAEAAPHRLEPRGDAARIGADARLGRRHGLLPRALLRLPRPPTSDVVGRGEYGERFASIVERDNVAGVQFHPEKSSARRARACWRNFARRGAA